MAWVTAAVGVASFLVSAGTTAAQMRISKKTTEANVEREKKLGVERSKARLDELRRTIAAQRVAIAAQGGDPDVGTALELYEDSFEQWQLAERLDKFQTDAVVANYGDAGKSKMLQGYGTLANTLYDYTQTATDSWFSDTAATGSTSRRTSSSTGMTTGESERRNRNLKWQ